MDEMMTTNGNGRSVMVAAVLGAAVGAGVALLLAPCSGKDTRKWLASQRNTMKNKATSAFEQGKKVIQSAAEQVGSVADMVSGHEATGATAKSSVRRMNS